LADTNPQVLFDTGVNKLKAGKYQEAVDLFSEVIITIPGNAKARKNRGVALMNLGNLDAAIDDFRAAINMDSRLTGLYSNLGAALHYKGEYEEAIECYDRATGETPSRPLIYFNRGLSKLALARFEEALTDFEKALELDPEFDAAVSARREVLNRQLKTAGKAQTATKTYSVQTGAFHVEANAIRSRQMLAEKGIESKISIFKGDDGKTWYRVSCGDHLDFDDAGRVQKELKNLFGIESIIRLED
jgi:tetratricopeptide (TPR) repeat protein